MSITPERVEQRLYELSKEVDEAHTELVQAEKDYHQAKIAFEIAIARARIHIGFNNQKMRVGDVADNALVACEQQFNVLTTAEAVVKAARHNSNRIRIQVDIARSIGTSVRASLEI